MRSIMATPIPVSMSKGQVVQRTSQPAAKITFTRSERIFIGGHPRSTPEQLATELGRSLDDINAFLGGDKRVEFVPDGMNEQQPPVEPAASPQEARKQGRIGAFSLGGKPMPVNSDREQAR
jgi:hypothetical protein